MRPLTSSQCAFKSKKGCCLKNGMNSLAFSSWPIYKSYIGQRKSALLGWVLRGADVYLLGTEPRAALDHATPLYTALGNTVKKVVEFTAESITSLSNLERSIQIRRRILLKLQISEQTPLMWKPGKILFNKHKSPPFTMDLILTTGTNCGRNGLMFSSVFKCFTQLFPALQSFKYYQIWKLFLMWWHYLFILHRLPPFIKPKSFIM